MINSKEDSTRSDVTEFKIDRTLIRELLARRKRSLIVGSTVGFSLVLLFGLFGFPQSYTSQVSIAIQSDSATGGISMLANLGTGVRKYLGVLKSRRFAVEVERVAHLQSLYNLPNAESVFGMYQRSIKLNDDPVDGLLYIDVSLSAPARLMPDPTHMREKVRQSAALVANEYAKELHRYLEYTDVEKDSVLLRAAEVQLTTARANYNASVDAWMNKIRRSNSRSLTMVAPSLTGSEGLPAAALLQSLYISKGTLESGIKAASTSIAGAKNLIGGPPGDLSTIPSEDQLLQAARRDYNAAYSELRNYQTQYADAHPFVVKAKARLRIAEQVLHDQAASILSGHTSEQIKVEAQNAELEVIDHQIADAEKHVSRGINLAAEDERLHSEVLLNMDVLRTTATQYATLKLQTVSGASRMSVVDSALPALKSGPGLITITVMSALATATVICIWMLTEFVLTAMARSEIPEGASNDNALQA